MKLQNTEAIFEIVGNYPVVDQFDVLYSNLMSGSTYDNYITGSLLTRVNVFGVEVYLKGDRGLAFSRLGVDRAALPSVKSQKNSYEFQPWRERAGTIRNVRIFSESERFYDSLTPNISKMVKALNGSIVKLDLNTAFNFGFYNAIVFDNDVYNPSDSLGITPVGFELSFPFEPAFSGIPRDRRFSQSIISDVDISNSPVDTFQTKTLLIIEEYSGSHFIPSISPPPASSSFNANFWLDSINKFSAPSYFFGPAANENDSTKVLFGFGDRNSYMIKDNDNVIIGRKNLPDRRYFLDSAAYYTSISPIIRGWKYGLIDGNPHYTSTVFRRDRFGQFRDMLEQRLFSSTIQDSKNSPVNYLGGVETPAISSPIPGEKVFIENPPVQIGFVKQTIFEQNVSSVSSKKLVYVNEKPTNTWSSNLSEYATSSLPYFDGVSRNRTPTTIIPSSFVVTTLADTFGKIVIGT